MIQEYKKSLLKEHKELLLKDLCARLPYGVKVHAKFIDTDTNTKVEKVGVLSMIDTDTVVAFSSDDTNCYIYVTIHEVKPYLFPLSSMTEEQKEELNRVTNEKFNSYGTYIDNCKPRNWSEWGTTEYNWIRHHDIDLLNTWLDKNHFDYRGLIEKGLAIDATNLNIY